MTYDKELLRKAQFLLAMACSVAPIPLLIYVAFAPDLVNLFWVMPLAFVLLSLVSFKAPGKRRLLCGYLLAAVLPALGVAAMLIEPNPIALVVPVIYAVLLVVNLPMAGWGLEKELPSAWFYAGIGLHIGVYVLKFLFLAIHEIVWDAINPWMTLTFFTMAIMVMLSLTRFNLNNSANGRQKPSDSMRQKNLILTVLFFAVAMLIALIPSIYEWIDTAVNWLIRTIKELIDNIEIDYFTEDTGGGGGGAPPASSDTNLSFLDQLVTFLLNCLFVLVGCVAVYLVLRTLIPPIIRRIRRLFTKLRTGLTEYATSASEDYIDEVTSLQPPTDTRQKKVRLSSAEERNLPPAERIRYRYRRLLYKHPAWTGNTTARENLPNNAAALYEKARYSSHPITEEEANDFKSNPRRV